MRLSTGISILLAALVALSLQLPLYAQEIDFGGYYAEENFSILLDTNGNGLDFGHGLRGTSETIEITEEVAIMSITGVKFLDVFVEISTPDYLEPQEESVNCTEEPDRCIQLDLRASYANLGEENSNHSIEIQPSTLNEKSSRFPILRSWAGGVGAPPVPPPPPETIPDQAAVNEIAYLYFYGTIHIGENAVVGSHQGLIEVTVSYEEVIP